MSTEKMRGEFQEWWRHREQTELRSSFAMGWAFLIWQASRAAIEVDISELDNLDSCDASEVCKLAIESLGLKVKP